MMQIWTFLILLFIIIFLSFSFMEVFPRIHFQNMYVCMYVQDEFAILEKKQKPSYNWGNIVALTSTPNVTMVLFACCPTAI